MYQLGDYDVLHKLAAGGMGTVFLARRRGLEGFSRLVAIKQLHPQYTLSEEGSERFAAEARIGGQISHPNIVAALGFERHDDEVIIVMEYVHGLDLGALLRVHDAPLPEPVAAHIAREVLSGLEAAHEHRADDGAKSPIIHRDLTPRNVLVSRAGEVKISDFGMAHIAGNRMTRGGGLRGTVGYMSPEQAAGKPVDARSDVYSTGLLLYEMLTGQPAYDGDEELAILADAQRGEAAERPMPGVSDELQAIVRRGLQLEGAARYQTARGFRDALDAVLERVGRPTREDVGALVHEYVAPISGLEAGERVTKVAGSAPRVTSDALATTASPAVASQPPVAPPAARRSVVPWLVAGAILVLGLVSLALLWPGSSATTRSDVDAAARVAEAGRPNDVAPPDAKRVAAQPVDAAPPADGPSEGARLDSRPTAVPRRRRYGTLVLNTVPAWSRVSVDGRARGTTPLRLRLRAGRHRLALWPLGRGTPRRLTVTIKAGEETKQILRIVP